MHLHIRLEPSGAIVTVDIEGPERVVDVKRLVAEEWEDRVDEMEVWWEGLRCEDNNLVGSLGVMDGDTLEFKPNSIVKGKCALMQAGVEPSQEVLLQAIFEGETAMVEAICESAAVPITAKYLHAACESPNAPDTLALTSLIMPHVTDFFGDLHNGGYPHHTAIAVGSLQILQYYHDRHPEVTTKPDVDRVSPLAWACIHGHSDITSYLLANGIGDKVNAADRAGKTPLFHACEKKHFGCVEALLSGIGDEVNLEVKFYMNDFVTPLLVAAKNGSHPICKLLIEKGADVHAADGAWGTALHHAAKGGHVSVCRVLLDNGIAVDRKDASHATALHIAFQNNHGELAGMLVTEYGASTDAKLLGSDSTPLHCAAMLGCHDVVAAILSLTHPSKHPALVNAVDASRRTPLHIAISRNYTATTTTLLSVSPNLNLADKTGSTALHLATQAGDADLVKHLLFNNADPSARDAHGKTPLYYAMKGGHKGIEEIIMKLRRL
eukprot:TRINITY_DN37390_c0_g1_i1.p1 TRINITY_DN37390_c0_g1~~TRINITY_DN37390_c0_g1_i1.p1  ORF type:complete len:511 (+),score=132.74 TRINITY_DN37390_c0_g1_i1:53-1534(+)